MVCGACGWDTRDGAAFCGGCGAKVLATCASCAGELEPNARFCASCGAVVAPSAADSRPTVAPTAATTSGGVRKIVTILFADLSGSTSLQERLDAEATRNLMDRVHELLRNAIEAQDGTVVKFTGDGVMAVFGIPMLREDDAARAVRSAVAMQAAFADLAASVVVDVGLRVGVNTGEVVVVPDTDDIVGDPVNVAARLEGAAGIGEVLIGPETARLVRDAVQLEAVEPLVLKGKRDAVAAARVIAFTQEAAVPTTPFVGRCDDLAALLAEVDRAVEAGSARLVTVLGTPGLGKSRLAGELAVRVADRARVVEARFLAGGGSSFGPVADALRRAAYDACDLGDDHDRVVGTISALLGEGTPGSTEQIFWSIRRAIEALAAGGPVVFVLDDLHWAEPVMLDLVEHLAEWLRGGGVLLLALARPELREQRPTLVEVGGPSASVLVLGALDEQACTQLAFEVLGAADVPWALLSRALEVSEGNPLFLRELLRLLIDDGVLVRTDAGWSTSIDVDAIELPATIHAAIAARIDQLDADQQQVLHAASVIGRHFARGALADLLPPPTAARLDDHLSALHRKALVDPEGTWWHDERLFQFHHVLIRDAAYRRVLKEVRADHHRRYADWLVAKVGDATAEVDEQLGWHLEQAVACERELGHVVDEATVQRAVLHLAAAGRRALDADDLATAVSLLARATELAPDDVDLLRDRCDALVSAGDVHAAESVVAELAAVARSERDLAIAAVYVAQLDLQRSGDAVRELPPRMTEASDVLARSGDDAGVAHAEVVAALAFAALGQIAACEAALDRSLAAARRAGDQRRANRVLSIAPVAALWGPSPIARASGRCLDVMRVLRITSWAPHVEAHALRCQAVLEAMRDRPDAARRMLDTARATFRDLGHRLGLLETAMHGGLVEILAGEPAAAEPLLRDAVSGFDAMGVRARSAQAKAMLARALLDQGRIDDAATVADPGIGGDDLRSSIGLRCVAAEVAARRGDLVAGERLAREAVSRAEPTDTLVMHADARLALARVLAAAGRAAEAEVEAARARELYETKGCTVGVRLAGDVSTAAEPAAATPIPSTVVQRRVPANLAVQTARRAVEAIEARDVDALAALYAPEYLMRDQRFFVDRVIEDEYRLFIERTDAFELEPIAALGERHVLVRVLDRFQEAATGVVAEREVIFATRVDADGRLVLHERFDLDHLADAVAAFIRLWAEDELTGLERQRGLVMAEVFDCIPAINDGDWERYRRWLPEDFVQVDHRPTSSGEVRGADATVAWMRELAAVSGTVSINVEDVLGCTPRALLWRNLVVGSTPDGGRYDRPSYAVFCIGPTGRPDRLEVFPRECVDDAWAAFDRFDATERAVPGDDGSVARLDTLGDDNPADAWPALDRPVKPARRVAPNRATAAMDEFVDAWRADDLDRFLARFSDQFTFDDRLNHVVVSAAEWLDWQRESFGTFQLSVEWLASLGERHALGRVSIETDLDDLGRLFVLVADDEGRLLRQTDLPVEALGQAMQLLLVSWGEHELFGSDRERARRMAGTFEDIHFPRSDEELDRARDGIAPEIVLVDRRPMSVGEVRGLPAVEAWLDELGRLFDWMHIRVFDVLALTPTATLYYNRVTGEAVGGTIERDSYLVRGFDGDGRVDRTELFPIDALDDAWDCFDRLAGPARMARRVRANRASESLLQLAARAAAGDLDGCRALAAEDYVFEHSTGLVLTSEENAAGHEADGRIGQPGVTVQAEIVATLGERHALCRTCAHDPGDDDVGERDVEWFMLRRVNADGLAVLDVQYEPHQLVSAMRRLLAAWAEDEAPLSQRESGIRSAGGFLRDLDAVAAEDWDAFREAHTNDVVAISHMGVGTHELRGADALVEYVKQLAADGYTTEPVDVLALTPRSSVVRWQIGGTGGIADAGEFEFGGITAARWDAEGRTTWIEHFDEGDADAALDRFHEWQTDAAGRTRRVTPNLASETGKRIGDAIRAGDLSAVAMSFAPGSESTNHILQLDLPSDDTSRLVAQVGPVAVHGEPLASLGKRHVLSRAELQWRDPEHGGHTAMHALFVIRVDEDGRVVRHDHFDEGDLASALGCLVRRWGEDELDGEARTRAMGMASTIEGFDVADVLALTPSALLYESSDGNLVATSFKWDGAIAFTEPIAGHDLVAAWAWFDALDIPVTGRRVEPLPVMRRVIAAKVAMQVDGSADVAGLHTDDFVLHLHALRQELPAEDRRGRAHLAGAVSSMTVETIATLPPRCALQRVGFRWRDPDDGGEVEKQVLWVTTYDDDGRYRRQDEFPDDRDLSEVLACLVERWAEEELTGVERDRALRLARTFDYARAFHQRDEAAMRAAFDRDVLAVDHTGVTDVAVVGREAVIGFARAGLDVADDIRLAVRDVFALTPRASLLVWSTYGTISGSAFEQLTLVVSRYGRDGNVDVLEVFPPERLDEAWATLGRLDHEIAPLTIEPTPTIRVMEAVCWALTRGDEAVVRLLAADQAASDLLALTEARAAAAADPLATRGPRLALLRIEDHLVVVETGEDGTITDVRRFERDDEDAGYGELDERVLRDPLRYGYPNAAMSVAQWRAFNAGDVDALRATYAEDAVFIDHRPLGFGTTDRSGYLSGITELLDRMTTFRYRAHEVLRRDEYGSVLHISMAGTSPGGGELEYHALSFSEVRDGLASRIELYPLDQRAEVLARFDTDRTASAFVVGETERRQQ